MRKYLCKIKLNLMKKNINIIKFLKFSTLLSFSFCNAQLSESAIDHSVGMNGSFEIVKNGLPVNWLVYTEKTVKEGQFKISIDDDSKQGNNSLKFSVVKCSGKGGWLSPGISQEINAKKNANYKVTLWAKNMGAEILIKINGVSSHKKDVGPSLLTSEIKEDWFEYKFMYKMPNDMERLRIEINLVKPGTIWLDDIRIEEVTN